MNKTIAMTLGPIIETISLGRKTSEIWAGSYLFSSLMRDILDKVRKKDGVEVIVPYVDDDALFTTPNGGIGKFHDRFILRSSTISIEDINKIVDELLQKMAEMMAEAITKRDGEQIDKEQIFIFLKSYIQPYMIETESDDIDYIYQLLDMLELHSPRIEGTNYMRKFIRRDVILKSKMAIEAFGEKPSFSSIPAIAAQEDDRDIEISENFKNAYRYIAIVHADGDNLGKALKAAGSATNLSKKLFIFGEKAYIKLHNYGAQIIYIGGDDLLFFAPVLHTDKRTIFNLIDEISEEFNQVFNGVTTISFGVSITYYKYPLYEALEKSRDALFAKAKNYKGKDAVAISVQKHSGQSFEFIIGKSELSYQYFEMLMGDILNKGSELPHSIHHKLSEMKPLILSLPEDKEIEPLFENFFNEELHKSRYKEGLEMLQKLMLTLSNSEQDKLFAMLSLIKLLRGDR